LLQDDVSYNNRVYKVSERLFREMSMRKSGDVSVLGDGSLEMGGGRWEMWRW
jgi:hypothetical protein